VFEPLSRKKKPSQLIRRFDTKGFSNSNMSQMYFRTDSAIHHETAKLG